MKIEIILDPVGEFKEFEANYIMESLGFLPDWVINEEYFDKDLRTALDEQYCCGLYDTKFASIDSNGTYKYKDNDGEDPDLYPMIKIVRGNETFYQYKYGLIGIVQKDGSSFCGRMD